MSISNNNGRVLEFVITKAIIDFLPAKQVKVSPVTLTAQKRDRSRTAELSEKLQKEYSVYASTILDWLEQEFSISKHSIILDRLSDHAAVKGDVTDIRILIGSKIINLSIKHNHSALKHQRPPTVAIHCGYSKGSKEDLEYRNKYQKIIKEFLKDVKTKFPKATAFNKIKSKESTYIDKHLYRPVCLLVAGSINKLCLEKPEKSKLLFRFLVGNTDFYKLRAANGLVEIQEFSKILGPDKVKVTTSKDSYVNLEFSNNWKLSMRLHTAATRLGSSLKFDTQLINNQIPSKILKVHI